MSTCGRRLTISQLCAALAPADTGRAWPAQSPLPPSGAWPPPNAAVKRRPAWEAGPARWRLLSICERFPLRGSDTGKRPGVPVKGNRMCPVFQPPPFPEVPAPLTRQRGQKPRQCCSAWEGRSEAQVPASWETRAAGAKVRPPAAGTGGLSGMAWAPARVPPSSLPQGRRVPAFSPARGLRGGLSCGGGATAPPHACPPSYTRPSPVPASAVSVLTLLTGLSRALRGIPGVQAHAMHVPTHNTVHTCTHTTPTHDVCMYIP